LAGALPVLPPLEPPAETFDCLAMTLEMPFKDSAITPDK